MEIFSKYFSLFYWKIIYRYISESSKLFVYDVFASYCDEDRQWVLDELLPQIESHPKISACLHERDFQVIIINGLH